MTAAFTSAFPSSFISALTTGVVVVISGGGRTSGALRGCERIGAASAKSASSLDMGLWDWEGAFSDWGDFSAWGIFQLQCF